MKHIKVLGSGCPRCQNTAAMVQAEADRQGIAIALEKVFDMAAIASYGLAGMPGVIIDDKIVHAGGVPKPEEVASWFKEE